MNKVSSGDFDTYSKETICFQLYMKIILDEIPYCLSLKTVYNIGCCWVLN